MNTIKIVLLLLMLSCSKEHIVMSEIKGDWKLYSVKGIYNNEKYLSDSISIVINDTTMFIKGVCNNGNSRIKTSEYKLCIDNFLKTKKAFLSSNEYTIENLLYVNLPGCNEYIIENNSLCIMTTEYFFYFKK